MKLALFSDIHGNTFALDAVLADIDAQGGVDEYWILGDLVAVGAQPIEVLERLSQLPNTRFTRGNTDGYMLTGDRPPPTPEMVVADLEKLPIYAEVASTMAWTQGALAATGWFDFLESLPLEQRLTLPDGTRLLGVHASPGQDNGRGILPIYTDEDVRTRFKDDEADLVCVGHTHWPMNVYVNDMHVINLGSVSNHIVPDLCAWYAILEADEAKYTIQHRKVDYEREAYVKVIREKRHPSGDYIIRFMRGEYLRRDRVQGWPLPEVL